MGKGYKGEGRGICLQNITDLHLGLTQIKISSDLVMCILAQIPSLVVTMLNEGIWQSLLKKATANP